jgi:hypothetical protein
MVKQLKLFIYFIKRLKLQLFVKGSKRKHKLK